jgi:hypothetical protein
MPAGLMREDAVEDYWEVAASGVPTYQLIYRTENHQLLSYARVARRSGWEDSDNQDENPASRRAHDRRVVIVAQEDVRRIDCRGATNRCRC